MTPVLQLEGVVKKYRRGDEQVHVLVDFDFTLDAGEFVVVTGPSGAGKSTLLHIAGGLDAPDTGTVAVAGQDMWAMSAGARAAFRRRNLGFVFQFFNLVPTLTAVENVSLPLVLDGMPTRSADAEPRNYCNGSVLGDRAWTSAGRTVGRTDATGGGGARAGGPAVPHPRRRADRKPGQPFVDRGLGPPALAVRRRRRGGRRGDCSARLGAWVSRICGRWAHPCTTASRSIGMCWRCHCEPEWQL